MEFTLYRADGSSVPRYPGGVKRRLPLLILCVSRLAAQPEAVVARFHEIDANLTRFETLLHKRLDQDRTLLVIRARLGAPRGQAQYEDWLKRDYLGLFVEEAGSQRRVAIVRNDEPGTSITVLRSRSNSVTLARADSDYGIRRPSLKLFFDAAAGRLVKSVAFDPVAVEQIAVWNGSVYAIARRAELAARIAPGRPQLASAEQRAHVLTDAAVTPPDPGQVFLEGIPQSSQDDLMRARGTEVREHRTGGDIEESAAALQVVGDQVWFGKTFYDGEGNTGVGAVGRYDRVTKKFTWFSPPDLVKWSVSALLVEGDTLWAGMMRRPEGAEYSGGLLRYNLATQQSTVIPVGEVIFSIVQAGGAVYLGTAEGWFVVRGANATHHVFEPTETGEYGIY